MDILRNRIRLWISLLGGIAFIGMGLIAVSVPFMVLGVVQTLATAVAFRVERRTYDEYD